MAIFERIRRIVKANIDWMLDIVEPAENELESKIKELQEVIHEGRESAAMYGATYKRLENDLAEQVKRRDILTSEAENAIAAGDENHARKLLGEKVKTNEKIAQLEPSVVKGKKSFEMLNANILKLQDQLRESKLKLRNLQARKDLADAQNAFDKKLGASGIDADGSGFERLEDEVLTSEAEVEIRSQMKGETLSDFDLQERSRELQVEAELQELMEKLDKADSKE